MECLEHLGFKIEYVCLDNECQDKFQCSQCFQQKKNHDLVKYMEFFQFLVDYCSNSQTKYSMEQISQYIHGKSLEKKLYFFNIKKQKPEEEFHELYIKKLCQNFDQFSNELQSIVTNAKNDLVQRYQRQVEEQFDKQVLNFQLYQKRGCQLIINQIQKNNTQHANENLHKLHTGQYEVSFAKKALFESYYEIRDQLEKSINQCHQYLQKLIKQIVVLSEKRIIDKQNQVIQSIAQRLGNKADLQQKRANIQIRLLSSEISKNESQSPLKLKTIPNKDSPLSINTSSILNKQISQLNQKSLTQRSQILSKSPINLATNLSSMYFSPQSQSKISKRILKQNQ